MKLGVRKRDPRMRARVWLNGVTGSGAGKGVETNYVAQ